MAPKKKPRATSKSSRQKGTGSGASRPGTADLARAKSIGLHEFMAALADRQVASTAPKGACLISDANTGDIHCTLTTEDFCKTTLKGTFVGGLCGGA
jgi:hypothetical protein